MKFYIATTLSNAARAQQVRDRLTAAGHRCVYDWTTHGAVGHLGREALENVAVQEMLGVLTADVLIVLLPGGKGTHAELGMAIAMGKPIIIWDETGEALNVDDKTCSFYWLPFIKQRFSGELHSEAIDLLVHTAEQVHADEQVRRHIYAVR